MHRSRNSVCLNHYIASLTTILSEHHGEFGTKPHALRQMSRPSDSGSDLAKNNADIIDNGVHNFDFDFTHDHDAIQAQECAQIIRFHIQCCLCESYICLLVCPMFQLVYIFGLLFFHLGIGNIAFIHWGHCINI